MVTVRVASVIALVAMIPATGLSQFTQSTQHFKDGWFWGVKGGLINFSTSTMENRNEPVYGAEWLLTRTQGALYVSFDQSLFDATSAFRDTTGASRTVDIQDMQRFTMAAMAFPFAIDAVVMTFRPYAGVGFALNFLRSAELVGAPPADSATRADVNKRLDNQQDRAAPLLILGLQANMGRLAFFIQGTGMPARANFLLNGSPTYFAEAGIRFNAGTSKDPRTR